jgi:choline dehydrogenase-like flavoprotein
MGPAKDPEPVVDTRLSMYGIEKYRVVDAGVIPMQITGHTNGPVLILAEMVADSVKEGWQK